MQLTTTWKVISEEEVLIQNLGNSPISLCYAGSEPSIEPCYALGGLGIQKFPKINDKKLYGRTGGGTASITTNDTSGAGLDTNKYFKSASEEAIFRGEMSHVRVAFEGLAIDDSIYILVNVGVNNLFVSSRNFSFTSDKVIVEIYAGANASGGTAVSVNPYNNVNPVPTGVSVFTNPTVVDEGVLFDEFLFLGSTDPNASKVSGGFRSDENIRIMPAGGILLLKVINKGTTSLDGIIKYLFFERDVGVPLY